MPPNRSNNVNRSSRQGYSSQPIKNYGKVNQDIFFSKTNTVPKSVYASSFVSSFIGFSRKGDLFDPSISARSASWCNWFISSFNSFKGLSDREYIGVSLPAKFYDYNGFNSKNNKDSLKTQPVPHLEIPAKILNTPTPFFPYNLGLVGNALLSPSWIFSEIVSLRKALFTDLVDVSYFAKDLASYRSGLVDSLTLLNSQLESSWTFFESLIISNPNVVSEIILQGFTSSDVSKILRDFPYDVSIFPEPSFADSQKSWISRRLGVWRVGFSRKSFKEPSSKVFSFGVTTPRVTFNSLFNDPLFSPNHESVAALLVRVLLLSSLLELATGNAISFSKIAATDNVNTLKFRPILARTSARSPQASIPASIAFVHFYKNPDSAWAALSAWAGNRYVLTVSNSVFVSSFYNVKRSIARLEEPARSDIDNILPLCWSGDNVYRVSFVHN